MGRKGVSKHKKANAKTSPVSGNNSTSIGGLKAKKQPEQVVEKGKTSPKDNKKH